MTITRVFTAICDNHGPQCVGWVAQTVRGAGEARRQARVEGWTCVKGKDVCPKCQPPKES